MKGIAHAAFNVSDMERALRFYRETFGFEKAFELKHPETGEPWIVYVHAGGNQFIELFYGGVNPQKYHTTDSRTDLKKETANRFLNKAGKRRKLAVLDP